jgi:hypothetical protein
MDNFRRVRASEIALISHSRGLGFLAGVQPEEKSDLSVPLMFIGFINEV